MADELRQFKFRRGTSAAWAAAGTVLAAGEPGYDTTVKRVKIGDGVTGWAALAWTTLSSADVARLDAAAVTLAGALTPTDAAMAVAAGDLGSAFNTELMSRIGSVIDEVTGLPSLVAAEVTAQDIPGRVDEALAGMDVVQSEVSEETLAYPSTVTVDSVAIVDADGLLIGVIDDPGTPTSHLRDARVLYPSGDVSGATDTGAINAALVTYRKVVMMSGEWFWNGPPIMNSFNHLHMEGFMIIHIVNGSNCNLVTNNISATPTVQIALTASGRVVLDGNGVHQTRQPMAAWKNIGLHFVNVDGLIVQGITWANTQCFGALMVHVKHARWLNCRSEQDDLCPNQDGLDIGPGCSDIRIYNFTGNSGDDAHSFFAKFTTSASTLHPIATPGGALYINPQSNDTHDVRVYGTAVDAGSNFIRMQAAEGSKLYDIEFYNVAHTGTEPVLALVAAGEMVPAYITSPPATDGSDFHDILVSGISGRCTNIFTHDSNLRDVKIKNVDTAQWTSIYTQRNTTDPAPYGERIIIDGVTSSQTGNAASTIVNLNGGTDGMTLKDSAIVNVRLRSVGKIMSNVRSTVIGLELEAVVGEILSTPFTVSSPVVNEIVKLDVTSRAAVSSWGTLPAGVTVRSGTHRLVMEAA